MRRIFSSILIIILILYTTTACGIGNINMPLQGEDQDEKIDSDELELPDANTQLANDAEPSLPKKGGTLSIPIPQLDTVNPLLTQSKELISFLG